MSARLLLDHVLDLNAYRLAARFGSGLTDGLGCPRCEGRVADGSNARPVSPWRFYCHGCRTETTVVEVALAIITDARAVRDFEAQVREGGPPCGTK